MKVPAAGIPTTSLTSGLMVDEPVLLFKEGGSLIGTLLFPPSNLHSIKAWGENTGEFKEIPLDTFNVVKGGNRTFLETTDSSLPCLTRSALVKPPGAQDGYPSTSDGKNWLLFSEAGLFHKLQLRVTYAHEERWSGPFPVPDGTKLPGTKKLIEEGGNIDFFILGDSISAGCNCSKMLGLSPFQPDYAELLQDGILEKIGEGRVNLKNASVGGESSEGGKRILKKVLKSSKRFQFDLNIIAWGANDAGGKRDLGKFEKNIKKQVKMIQKRNPAAEFILVASSLPNKAWIHSQHELIMAYRNVLGSLAKEMGERFEIADITCLWQDLLARKDYYDLTGNGLNHPNDWGHMLYAESIASLLGGSRN